LTVTFCPAEVVSVKPDADTLVTLPDDPPAAGPDRALDPPPPVPNGPPGALEATCEVVAAVAVLEPLLEVALTIPNALPATASAAAPAAIHLVSLVRKNMVDLLWSMPVD
jgi:hypothetical protein